MQAFALKGAILRAGGCRWPAVAPLVSGPQDVSPAWEPGDAMAAPASAVYAGTGPLVGCGGGSVSWRRAPDAAFLARPRTAHW
jgi:hypothetical protein